ncbi:MAG TPA: hypothetical protein VKV05_05425 [Terriglobales bacterium]|nr:hypothetical protein [Terriglobales bacterium]
MESSERLAQQQIEQNAARAATQARLLRLKRARQCQHIKANGEFCGSPALRGRRHCYFHLTHIGRRIRAERLHAAHAARPLAVPEPVLELPPLEDANSIQLALMQVIDALLRNRLDPKRAGLVLYALQTASSNLANGANFQPMAGATVAGRYPDFEEDFELGGDAPELKAEEANDEKQHAAEVAQIKEMAETCARLDAAEEEAHQKQEEAHQQRIEQGDDETDDDGPAFHCDRVSQFFCSINGPLSHAGSGAAAAMQTVERDAPSQRLELFPVPLRPDDEDNQEEAAAA